MKLSIKPALITMCVSCALLIPQLSNAGEHEKGKHKGPLSELSLSQEQQSAIKELGPRSLSSKHHKEGLKNIAPVVLSSDLDSVQLELLVDASIAKRKAEGLYAVEHKFAVQHILSEEQLAKLKAIHETKREHRSKPESKNGQNKKTLEQRLTTKLSLTDDQLAQMQTHFDALTDLRETSKAQRESFQVFESSLMQQDTFDSTLWLAQFDLVSSSMKANNIAFATHMHEIYMLLDSEQRTKFRHRIMKPKGKNKGKNKEKRES